MFFHASQTTRQSSKLFLHISRACCVKSITALEWFLEHPAVSNIVEDLEMMLFASEKELLTLLYIKNSTFRVDSWIF
jgi:hypothetical protein